MKQYIKLYEQYEEDSIMEKVYESVMERLILEGKTLDFINFKLYEDDNFEDDENEEDDNWEDDENEELSSGEKRAESRGLQLMTKPQMAAIYLLAKGKSEDVGADYVKMIDGVNAFGYTDEHDGSFNITIPGLADAIGMDSDRTLSYTLKKFMNLIDGIGETISQSLSIKIISAYEALSQMNDVAVANIASRAIQDASYTKNRDAADSRKQVASDKAAAKRQEKKKLDEKIGLSVNELVKTFKKLGFDQEKYSRMIYAKLSKEYPALDKNRIYDIYFRWLTRRGMEPRIHIDRPIVA